MAVNFTMVKRFGLLFPVVVSEFFYDEVQLKLFLDMFLVELEAL